MDPNNLNNLPNSELGDIQPLGPQPFGQQMPEQQPQQPMQPMEHSMQPLQPLGQPLGQPMEQPMQPMQQPVQSANPMQPQKTKKPNFALIGIIAGALILIAVVVIVVAISANGGNKSNPPMPTPEPEETTATLTPELAKSVCTKHDGIFESFEDEYEVSSLVDIESFYTCKYYKNAQDTDSGYYVSTYVTGDFEYQINYIQENKLDEYWSRAKEGFKGITDSNITVLKDSGDMIGYYGSILVNDQDGQGIRSYVYSLLYDDMAIMLTTYGQNDSLAKNILKDLGIPDPEEAKYSNSGNSSNDPKATVRDTQRRDDYSMTVTAVNSYMASNNGKITNLIAKNDPATLKASRWINESGEDPNGKPYELKAYSWDAWNNAPVTPFGTDGSQVFIVINANCNGTDANGNRMPAKDKAVRSFAVYGYLESGTFCQASGSAE